MFGIRTFTNSTWGVSLKFTDLKDISLNFVSGFVEEVITFPGNETAEAIELPLGDEVPIMVTAVASTINDPNIRQQVISIISGSLPNMLI